MAVPSNYRWIVVGNLAIRNRKNAPHYAPQFELADLCNAINGRIAAQEMHRSYGNDSRLMWCEKIVEEDNFIRLILEVGDKNVTGVSFLHFETLETRDIEKEENEGGHYAAHILIGKTPDQFGRHLILIEKVPGIHISSVKDHFAWACHDPAYEKAVQDDDGNPKNFRAIFEIDGHQSKTIREALQTGVLQDVEFVSHEENHADGLDEEPIIQEVVHEARWEVKRRVTEDQARGIFERFGAFLENFHGGADNTHIFVRIKADNGQIKRAEVEHNADEILEQAFVQNEVVSDFAVPLPHRYEDFRDDLLIKMRLIADNVGN
jgi:DNA-binding Lrp family transcriptional regulator